MHVHKTSYLALARQWKGLFAHAFGVPRWVKIASGVSAVCRSLEEERSTASEVRATLEATLAAGDSTNVEVEGLRQQVGSANHSRICKL